jgi:DNA polymerase-3 subunit epsilon
MPEEAFRVHGLSSSFLAGKPTFRDIAEDFLSFVKDAKIVAHNAEFDMRFINAELSLLGFAPIASDLVVDTLALARRRHPGAPNSLDALCSRYGIDNSRRTKHGALLDAEILAEVYAELTGGRQSTLLFGGISANKENSLGDLCRFRPVALRQTIEVAEFSLHRAFLNAIGDKAIWHAYFKE